MNLVLDVATHRYSIGDRVLPSVTQALSVIESFDHVPPAILERARLLGHHVHTAVDLYNCGDLDEANLDEQLVPRLSAWKRFLGETGFVVTHHEEIVCSLSLGYAGKLDVRGLLKGIPTLIDLKSGAVPRSVGPQTEAYRQACSGEKPRRRLALQLREDGTYKIIECREASDFSNFLSALNVYRYQRRNPSHGYEKSGGSQYPIAQAAGG